MVFIQLACEVSTLDLSFTAVLIHFKALFSYIVKPIYWILSTVLKALTSQKKVISFSRILTLIEAVKNIHL